MSASVTVGFSPASSGVVALPGSDASSGEDASGGNLFAALLDLIGAQLAPAVADATQNLPSVASDVVSLFGGATAGKTMLQDLGDALASAGASLASGQALDDAQEKQLREALDAVAAVLGGVPNVMARQPSTTSDKTSPSSSLSQLLAGIGGDLRSSAPEFADKLDAIAAQLKSKGATPDLLESIGLSDDVAADIAKLVEAFKAKGSATKPAEPAQLASPVLPAASDLTASSDASVTRTDGTAPTAGITDTAQAKPHANIRMQPVEAPAADDKPKSDAIADPPSAPDVAAEGQASQAASTSSVPQPARLAHAAYAAPVQQINIPQVAFEVFRQFQAGNTRFQIRLDPPELGRIDVKLDLDKHGTINARMVVERPETLDLMQRDQRALQQALNQAGLDTGKTNLEFSLRQSPFSHEQFAGQGQQGGSFGSAANATTAEEATESPVVTGTYYRGTAAAGGVNLFV